jgi:hypothetical protein
MDMLPIDVKFSYATFAFDNVSIFFAVMAAREPFNRAGVAEASRCGWAIAARMTRSVAHR